MVAVVCLTSAVSVAVSTLCVASVCVVASLRVRLVRRSFFACCVRVLLCVRVCAHT